MLILVGPLNGDSRLWKISQEAKDDPETIRVINEIATCSVIKLWISPKNGEFSTRAIHN